MPDHTAADFGKPRVVGLAIHNAQKAEHRARVEWEEAGKVGFLPLEVQAYCLFLVRPDCSVESIGAAATAGDFARLASKANLRLLAAKYKPIGFVTKRTPKARAEWGAASL